MDSPLSVVSPLKTLSIFSESDKQNTSLLVENSYFQSRGTNFQGNGTTIEKSGNTTGAFLEVYIHQARDIHNICIYQKQDVYAKLSLTSDPENTISTKIIDGGGRNPIFNENFRLNVQKIDSSLKCEIWMLSRVKNYLEDQLLGFALVPVSEILLQNGKLEKEFSLSSTDLLHSPAGFVQLSVSYVGAPPEVIPIPAPSVSVETESVVEDVESSKNLPCDLDKIEFPDPKVANENHQMVEEYIAMPCSSLDTQTSYSLVSSDTGNPVNLEVGVQNDESLPMNQKSSNPCTKTEDSAPSSLYTNGTSTASPPVSSQSCETPEELKSPNEEHVSPPRNNPNEESANVFSTDNNASVGLSSTSVNIEVEPELVQQDFVDLYLKSVQQSTVSLAKMNLPGDLMTQPTSSSNSSTDQKSLESKNSGSRVFYGSRAFF